MTRPGHIRFNANPTKRDQKGLIRWLVKVGDCKWEGFTDLHEAANRAVEVESSQ